jgi:hypothetical protein
MMLSRCWAVFAAAAVLAFAGPVSAQNSPPPASAAPPISQDLLDALLAPIALYPDQLLAQLLMASTYPLEVVEAARFVKANPDIRGAALDNALRDRTWDASVLSLTAFPQVLDMMSEKLEWTQRLGDAFLDDPEGVMRTVQGLRARAQQAGNLQNTEQQRIVMQDQAIMIEPAQPQVVYVPVYNPTVIYGTWWAPAYQPWFWYPPPIWGYPPRPYNWGFYSGFFWGSAWAITANNWGWCRPNWGGHNIYINVNNNNVWVNRPVYRNQYQNNGNWNHDAMHRRGVAYRDTATGNKYRPTNSAGVQTRESYRGRDNATRATPAMDRPGVGSTNNATRPAPGMERPSPGANNNLTRPMPGTTERNVQGAGNISRPSPSVPTARPSTSGTRPAYQPESRPQVQRDASRGAQSRAAMQPSAPSMQRSTPSVQHSAPGVQQPAPGVQHAAPSGNRGGGGGGGASGGGGGNGRGHQ